MGTGDIMNSANQSTEVIIERFNEAFNRHDVDAVMALMTEDVVFENTSPAPDGERYEGQSEVRAFWERFFPPHPTRTSKQRTSLPPATVAPLAGGTTGAAATSEGSISSGCGTASGGEALLCKGIEGPTSFAAPARDSRHIPVMSRPCAVWGQILRVKMTNFNAAFNLDADKKIIEMAA